MKLEIKNNSFIEIDDLIKVNNISCNLDNYQYENGTLKGQFQIQGEYIKDSSSFDKPFNFLNYVPFEIVFVEKVNEIRNISVEGFEYFEVERRGIETEITIVINDDERELIHEEEVLSKDNENNYEEEVLSKDSENNYEDIKDEVENEITNVLDQTFIVDSNKNSSYPVFPTSTKRTTIKIFGDNK